MVVHKNPYLIYYMIEIWNLLTRAPNFCKFRMWANKNTKLGTYFQIIGDKSLSYAGS